MISTSLQNVNLNYSGGGVVGRNKKLPDIQVSLVTIATALFYHIAQMVWLLHLDLRIDRPKTD